MAEPIEFGINPNPRDASRAFLVVKCARSLSGQCEFGLWTRPAQDSTWHWNGKFREATVSPSIDCKGGCGRHFSITDGKAM